MGRPANTKTALILSSHTCLSAALLMCVYAPNGCYKQESSTPLHERHTVLFESLYPCSRHLFLFCVFAFIFVLSLACFFCVVRSRADICSAVSALLSACKVNVEVPALERHCVIFAVFLVVLCCCVAQEVCAFASLCSSAWSLCLHRLLASLLAIIPRASALRVYRAVARAGFFCGYTTLDCVSRCTKHSSFLVIRPLSSARGSQEPQGECHC